MRVTGHEQAQAQAPTTQHHDTRPSDNKGPSSYPNPNSLQKETLLLATHHVTTEP